MFARRKRNLAVMAVGAAVAAIVAIMVSQAGGEPANTTPHALGNTTTKEAVVQALEGTGYEFRYRKTPRLAEYEVVSGEAIHGPNHIQFVVEIRLAGPFAELRRPGELNPQPGVLPDGLREEGTTVGNIVYKTDSDAPGHTGRGYELESEKAQTRMQIRVGATLEELFARKFTAGG